MVTGLTRDSAHNRNVEKSWIGFSIQDILSLGVFQSFLVGLCENVLKGDSIDVQRWFNTLIDTGEEWKMGQIGMGQIEVQRCMSLHKLVIIAHEGTPMRAGR